MVSQASMAGAAVWDSSYYDTLRSKAANPDKEVIEKTARQFESLLIEQIIKESKKVRFDDSVLSSSEHTRLWEDMWGQQLAVELAQRHGFGVAEYVVEAMEKQQTDVIHVTKE